ncbi:MAG: hypothetical protein OEZ38_05560 [Gammaproteobacteria bacterium]|nr:hypothetical protein [Gammaproteobacteria bacterium]
MMHTRNNILCFTILSTLGALSSGNAQAVDMKARAGIGFAYYELETPEIYGTVSAKNTSLNVGVTAGFGPIYVDAKVDTTLSGEHSTFATTDSLGTWGTSTPTKEDFSRDETTITIGYSVSESLAVFAGFKSTETELTAATSLLIGWEADVFKADGIFVGGAFGMPVSDNSSISASVAVAALDGDYTDSAFITQTGDTTGISFGLNYNLYLSDKSGISASWSYQQYEYAMGADTNPNSGITLAQDIVETYSNFGLSYFMAF